MNYRVKFLWDQEASVWIATSEDVPGLVLESGSLDALMERVKYAIPDLLELNHREESQYRLTFFSEREELVCVNG